jgi:hypothetical protein
MLCKGAICDSNGLPDGPWPKAFKVQQGKVTYVADFVAQANNLVSLERDLDAAQKWAANRFYAKPELAEIDPSISAAPLFLCTP